MIYHRVKFHVINNLQNQDASGTQPKASKLETIGDVSQEQDEQTQSPPLTKKTYGQQSPLRSDPPVEINQFPKLGGKTKKNEPVDENVEDVKQALERDL